MWEGLAAQSSKDAFRRPAILRFASDSFMEDFAAVLAKKPGTLPGYVAGPETWRGTAVVPATGAPAKPPVFKLYQPVHGRFYLVAASLTCRLAGLPDHKLRNAKGEAVSFVLRRIVPKIAQPDFSTFRAEQFEEYAWVDPDQAARWVRLYKAGVQDAEDKLPMFPTEFATASTRRRVFSGLVPVSRRQIYVAGREGKPKTSDPADDAPPEDPRKIELQRTVVQPWKQLSDWYTATVDPNLATAKEASSRESSAFILIDFSDYLQLWLKPVLDALQGSIAASTLTGKMTAVYNLLVSVSDPSVGLTLGAAIVHAKSKQGELEQSTANTLPSDYLPFRLTEAPVAALVQADPDQRSPLQRAIEDALPDRPAAAPFRLPSRTPANPQGDDWFILRCVFEHPQCGPNRPALLSPPSQPFQLAGYFDPDAPARNIQVALPIDVTPAGLRKFDKNVAFMISDQMNKQLGRIKGLKELMDGDVGDGGLELGFICSLSIPIITICAFFMLMIMLILLNIIFFWLPFFKICFPIPKLKAKA
jgi:hypothetical protein